MSADPTKIDPTKGEWYRRVERDPEKIWRKKRPFIFDIVCILALASVYVGIKEIFRPLPYTFNFALTLVFFPGFFYLVAKVGRDHDTGIPFLPDISGLDHDPDRDRPVSIVYHIDGVLIGEDTGWFGRRKEGVLFSGLETTFILSPENVQIEPGRRGPDDTRRMLYLNFPLGDSTYRIAVFPLGELQIEKDLDAASLVYATMADDGTTAPSTNITNPPPRSPSPSQRHTADFEYKFFWICATLIPILCALALWWWATNSPAKDSTVQTVLILSIPAMLGLVLIAVTDIHPRLASTRKKISELHARAQSPPLPDSSAILR